MKQSGQVDCQTIRLLITTTAISLLKIILNQICDNNFKIVLEIEYIPLTKCNSLHISIKHMKKMNTSGEILMVIFFVLFLVKLNFNYD